jgi:AcrR family transcriptional regulator
VRLFTEQGYSATTVEQVAEAAEVAPSTVFRYFATKQDLVFSQDYDLPFAVVLKDQAPGLTPMQAVRRAIRSILNDISEQELALHRERFVLILSEPELWGASLGNIYGTMQLMGEEVAKRAGRDPRDPAVRAYTGAVFGVMLQVSMDWANDPEMDFASTLDEALGCLEDLRP